MKTFEEALADLVSEYSDEPADTLISALELQIYALREEHGETDA